MTAGVSTPAVLWNNVTVAIVPNSIKVKVGKGTRNVRPMSSGGNSVTMVVTEDASTKKATVAFELPNTKANIDLVKTNHDLFDNNGIELVDVASSYTESFDGLTIVNDPELELTQDGKISVEMEGAPAA